MDSKDFTSRLAAGLGLTEAEAARRIQAIGAVLTACGESLDSVNIPRFGNFDVVKEDEREDIDLVTGRHMLMPPSITMQFSASAILRKAAEKGGQR